MKKYLLLLAMLTFANQAIADEALTACNQVASTVDSIFVSVSNVGVDETRKILPADGTVWDIANNANGVNLQGVDSVKRYLSNLEV